MEYYLNTLILGIVQGVCEFLPVSSSGHLAILQNFFNLNTENLVTFDLFLHCATVLVILIFFAKDIFMIISDWFKGWFKFKSKKEAGWTYGWMIIIATVITGLIGLPLRKIVEEMMSSTLLVGSGLIFTGIILAFVPLISRENKNFSPYLIAVVIGIAQGVAVLPGVSRSGLTMAAGLLMGMEIIEAFSFSFVISVPAVLGASLLEAIKIFKSDEIIYLPSGWVIGLIVAFVFGLLALNLMRKLVISGKWPYFGLYCLIVGAVTVLMSLRIF